LERIFRLSSWVPQEAQAIDGQYNFNAGHIGAAVFTTGEACAILRELSPLLGTLRDNNRTIAHLAQLYTTSHSDTSSPPIEPPREVINATQQKKHIIEIVGQVAEECRLIVNLTGSLMDRIDGVTMMGDKCVSALRQDIAHCPKASKSAVFDILQQLHAAMANAGLNPASGSGSGNDIASDSSED
jgi:hypothetical protein